MQLKRVKVCIGDKEFEIKELTCLARDNILNVIGSNTLSDVISQILPILDRLNVNVKDTKEIPVGQVLAFVMSDNEVLGALVHSLVDVLGLGPHVIINSIDNPDEDTELYVRNNLTVSQEAEILNKVVELNKLPDTIKNYKSLLTLVTPVIQGSIKEKTS